MLYSYFKLTVRSITLVGEADRKMLKAAIKQSSADQIRHRIIPNEAIIAMSENLAGLTDEIQEILHEEKEEKLVCLSDILIRVVLMGRCDKRIWS
jgi:ATP-dependent RNA helicase DDX27